MKSGCKRASAKGLLAETAQASPRPRLQPTGSGSGSRLAVAPVILLESHCAAARDTVQCLCVVKANPEPTVAFELPSRNVTVNETEREFVYSERSGLLLSSILTLRGQAQAPPRVICTSRNLYGTKSLELPFQGAREWCGPGMGATGGRGLSLGSKLPSLSEADHPRLSTGQAAHMIRR